MSCSVELSRCRSQCRYPIIGDQQAKITVSRWRDFVALIPQLSALGSQVDVLNCHQSFVRLCDCRLKGRRPLGDDVTYEITCEEKELYALTIDSTFSEHAGWFTCMATNAAGTALTEAKLTVERESIDYNCWLYVLFARWVTHRDTYQIKIYRSLLQTLRINCLSYCNICSHHFTAFDLLVS